MCETHSAGHSFLALGLIDSVVTWLAQKLTLPDTTMWGIQLVSTIFERILLFVICAAAIAATLVLTRWVRSPKLRPFVPLVGALALFRGLYAFFPGPRAGDLGLLTVLVMAVIHLPVCVTGRDFANGVPHIRMFRWFLSVIALPFLSIRS